MSKCGKGCREAKLICRRDTAVPRVRLTRKTHPPTATTDSVYSARRPTDLPTAASALRRLMTYRNPEAERNHRTLAQGVQQRPTSYGRIGGIALPRLISDQTSDILRELRSRG